MFGVFTSKSVKFIFCLKDVRLDVWCHCEVGRVTNKDSGVLLPLRTDEFVRREPAQGLEVFSMITGQQKGLQVLVEFSCALVMVALHSGLLNRAVQALDGSVGSRLGRLGHAVFYVVFAADEGETVPIGQEPVRLRH